MLVLQKYEIIYIYLNRDNIMQVFCQISKKDILPDDNINCRMA